MRRKVEKIQDSVQAGLEVVRSGAGNTLSDRERTEYKKRKMVQEVTEKVYILSRGEKFTTTISRPVTELTPEMITSGSWKTTGTLSSTFMTGNGLSDW